MACLFALSIVTFVLMLRYSASTIFHLEAEDFVTDKFALHRLNATGNESINFNQGQFIHVYFCLRKDSEVSIHDIRHSNDGGSDMFEISIDGIKLGQVVTPGKSKNGQLWNRFLSSHQVGPKVRLSSGYHVITLNFTSTDFYGVEIDAIEIEVEDKFLEEELFKCSLYCLADSLYDNGPARDDLDSILIHRKIYEMKCPKEDNILLPMYHKNVEFYMISAMLPRYRSFENHRESHYEGCVPPSDVIWNFANFGLPYNRDDNGGILSSNNAILIYNSMNLSHTMTINIRFPQPEIVSPSDDDVDTGHVISIRFKEVLYPFFVQMQYKGKSVNWSEEVVKHFTPQSREDIWTLSEHEWSAMDNNEVELIVLSDPNTPVRIPIEYIKMTRRRLRDIIHHKIYGSVDIQAEVVEIVDNEDGSKNTLNKMAVTRLDTGEVWDTVSYIRILHILPWSRKFGEVLRLDQSGKLKVLPMTPPGLDKLPFGSSFIIGQSNADDRHPRAPISHVGIDPGALQLYITYKDEGKANLLLKPSLHDTKVIVKDVKMSRNPLMHPFATVSSMWINDGNSEVDHISSNGNKVRHILNGWTRLYGTAFSFMKKCISKHNTQGPDMRVQLMTKRELFLYV